MVAVGMLLGWAGYALGLQGWCLFRDYNVTLGQLMSPFHPYDGRWPPLTMSPNVIWPGSAAAQQGLNILQAPPGQIAPGIPAPGVLQGKTAAATTA